MKMTPPPSSLIAGAPTPFSKGALTKAETPVQIIPVFSKWLGSWRISLQRRALSVSELGERYDSLANQWQNKVDRLGFPQVYEVVLRRLVGNHPPNSVLDCGIGAGALSRAIDRTLGRYFSLMGVDISPRMLEEAERLFRSSKAKFTAHHADAVALPVPDDCFDMAMTAHMLGHLPEPADGVAEMVRALKPGGRFLAFVTRRSLMGFLIHFRWHTRNITTGQARRLLRGAGLQQIQVIQYESGEFCRRLSFAVTGVKPFQDH